MIEPPNTGSNDESLGELRVILSAAVDGVLSAEQQNLLNDLLQSSPALRQEYVRIVANEALIEERLSKPLLELKELTQAVSASPSSPRHDSIQASGSESVSTANAPSSPDTNRDVQKVRVSGDVRHRGHQGNSQVDRATTQHSGNWLQQYFPSRKYAWSLAATVFVAATLYWAMRPAEVAKISALEDVHWATESTLEAGEDVLGRWIEIESGLVQIALYDAQIALCGPAKFRAASDRITELSHGTLTARVGPDGVGLVVETPSTTVTDLSTSFGVSVTDESTWVHVTEGRVRVKAHEQAESVIGSAGDMIRHETQIGESTPLEHFEGIRLQPTLSQKWKFIGQHPVNLDRNEFDQDHTAFMFLESSNRVLANDLTVNLQGAGTFRRFSRQSGSIPAGTRVNCYLLHCDPETSEHRVRGHATFSSEILGVLTDHVRLNETNAALGAGWTLQCDDIHRGLESTPEHNSDVVTISKDRMQLSATMSTRAIDQIRILVRTE